MNPIIKQLVIIICLFLTVALAYPKLSNNKFVIKKGIVIKSGIFIAAAITLLIALGVAALLNWLF